MSFQGLNDTQSRIIDTYIPYELAGQFDMHTIRWHVVVFLSEFVINRDVINAFPLRVNVGPRFPRPDDLRLKQPTDYLNWSGQKLYEFLKDQCG